MPQEAEELRANGREIRHVRTSHMSRTRRGMGVDEKKDSIQWVLFNGLFS